MTLDEPSFAETGAIEMMDRTLTRAEWIDLCTMRLGVLLPKLDPTEAASVATELQRDAYDCEPEEAAEIYALELAPVEGGYVCDYSDCDTSSWVLAYVMEGASEAQTAAGVGAAQKVLDTAGVSPYDAVVTLFRLEEWDLWSFAEEYALTAAESYAYDARCAAESAADEAVVSAGADAKLIGRLVARWPSKVRFEAARTRWAARHNKGA